MIYLNFEMYIDVCRYVYILCIEYSNVYVFLNRIPAKIL